MEDWAEIRRLHRSEGLAIKAIARQLGVARNTVRAALSSDGPPKYERVPAGSVVDEFEWQIRGVVVEDADDAGHGDRGADRVDPFAVGTAGQSRRAAAVVRAVDPADRTEYRPGEVVQCDLWFPPKVVRGAADVWTAPDRLTNHPPGRTTVTPPHGT